MPDAAARFLVIPAIDLRAGRCVRLTQGDYARETVYAEDPVAVALGFAAAGARRIHLVDLDGARDGTQANLAAVTAIAAAVRRDYPGVVLDLGGGLRDAAAIERVFAAGVDIAILGTLAVEQPAQAGELAARWPDRVAAGLDGRGGRLAVRGWLEQTEVRLTDAAADLAARGLAELIVTDIDRDGMLEAPNVDQLAAVAGSVPVPVIASGGVTTVEHLLALRDAGLAGAIVGKAIYSGALDLDRALAATAGVA